MSKLYANKTTAQKIADKLSAKGEAHEVVEQDGQFRVAKVSEQPEPGVPDFTATESAEAPAASKKGGDELLTYDVPGARLTKMYVITPPIGKSKVGARPRWFERKRLVSAETIEGGVRMVLTRKALTTRQIDTSGLELVAA